jgi:hypothetical protein
LVKEEGTPRLQSDGASTGFGYNSGWSGLEGSETESLEPDIWGILSFDGPTTPADVRALINRVIDGPASSNRKSK